MKGYLTKIERIRKECEFWLPLGIVAFMVPTLIITMFAIVGASYLEEDESFNEFDQETWNFIYGLFTWYPITIVIIILLCLFILLRPNSFSSGSGRGKKLPTESIR